MKCVGVITEYNPFHQGHLYQLNEIRKRTGADYIIAIMSGNFVQRGAPAFLDKYARTDMALCHGADLVLELPVCYATASAEFFALGAVLMLHKLNIVDQIVFGSECGDLALLSLLADLFNEEPKDYQNILKMKLKEGLSFPKARAVAALNHLNDSHLSQEAIEEVLNSPNNILAIEYLRVLKRLKSPIVPMTIKREGATYHSVNALEQNASASAIRKAFQSFEDSNKDFLSHLPLRSRILLQENYLKTFPVTVSDFSSLLYYRLTSMEEPYSDYFDVSDELSNRIKNLVSTGLDFDTFTDALKTKQLTRTRIARGLFHLLLKITQKEMDTYKKNQIVYGRILGFYKDSSQLLKHLRKESLLPLITKPADAKKQLSEEEYRLFCHDCDAARLYTQIVYDRYHTPVTDEMKQGPVIISDRM